MKKCKTSKRRKIKFVQSLLNPTEHTQRPKLIKQRIPLYEQFTLPTFKKSEFQWMKFFKSNSEDNIMLRRTLISTNGEFIDKSEESEKSEKRKKSLASKESSQKKGHLKTCSGFGVIFEPQPLNVQTKTQVYYKTASTTRGNYLSHQPLNYVKKSFDTRVIPEKHNNLVTLQDLLRFVEYSNRPQFK